MGVVGSVVPAVDGVAEGVPVDVPLSGLLPVPVASVVPPAFAPSGSSDGKRQATSSAEPSSAVLTRRARVVVTRSL